MRYLLLILLLAGGYYGWDYYQNGLAPRHEALKAMEQEPCPELDAAQARFDEAAELHEQQAVRLQKAVQRKEEAYRHPSGYQRTGDPYRCAERREESNAGDRK